MYASDNGQNGPVVEGYSQNLESGVSFGPLKEKRKSLGLWTVLNLRAVSLLTQYKDLS